MKGNKIMNQVVDNKKGRKETEKKRMKRNR